jgi:hypothetical protein
MAAPRDVHQFEGSFKVPDDIVPPPLIAGQHVVLLNIAHERMSPISDKPAVRLLGLFHTEEEARAMVPAAPSISYYVCPTHKFLPLISGLDVSPEATTAAILKLHAEHIEANKKDFKATVDDQRTGDTGKSIRAIRTRSERTRAPRTVQVSDSKPVAPLTADCQLLGQSFAVITMLHDIRPASLSGEAPLEPLIAVLHAAGSIEDARNYAKYTATNAYPNNDIIVVDMYKWLHLEHVDFSQVVEEHANNKLDLMKKHRRITKQKISEVAKHSECIIEVDGKPKNDLPKPDAVIFHDAKPEPRPQEPQANPGEPRPQEPQANPGEPRPQEPQANLEEPQEPQANPDEPRPQANPDEPRPQEPQANSQPKDECVKLVEDISEQFKQL